MTAERLTLELEVSAAGTAAALLAGVSGLSRQRVKQAMQCGAVWLGRGRSRPRRLRRASRQLRPGDRLYLYYDPQIIDTRPPAAQLIADQQSYSIWNKPCGMWSQGSKWGDHCTIQRWAEQRLQRPAFPVHRLDRAARGLILIAHRKRTAAAFAALFRQRLIDKRYRAWVEGAFPPQPRTLDQPLEGHTAISHVRRLAYDPERHRSLLEIRIETGRKHQIRRHLQQAGHPIVGDRRYGTGPWREDLQLEAWSLRFDCPECGDLRHYQLPSSD